jgi:hypothetical protein
MKQPAVAEEEDEEEEDGKARHSCWLQRWKERKLGFIRLLPLPPPWFAPNPSFPSSANQFVTP